uniref:Nuclear transport factor 2 n=2 Tax=Ailuropoda melanoleuca TaxID=9646 RepID=G1MKW1_AILME
MGHKPTREQTRSSFIQHYYQLLDKDRTQRGTIYIDVCLTWEEQQFQGKTAIVEKLPSLPLQKIQHSITGQDCQSSPDSCIISKVVDQLKADEDPIVGVHQMFLLKTINDAWVCTNDMFRLVLHNFSWPPPSLALNAVSSSLVFPILFTVLQMLQTFYTNEWGRGGGRRSVLPLPRCIVHDVLCAWASCL